MDKNSLIFLRESIITSLSDCNIEELELIQRKLRKINIQDRGELMINSYHFFAPENYDRNVKVLRKNDAIWKKL